MRALPGDWGPPFYHGLDTLVKTGLAPRVGGMVLWGMTDAWEWELVVPASQERLLLLALMALWCDEGGKEVRIETLQAMTKMSKSRIGTARDWLIKRGVLEYKPRV